MRTLSTDENNDILIDGRSPVVVDGVEAILIVARACAQTILGEMIFNATGGMPYFETIWVGAPSTAPFEAAFRQRIMQIDGVTRIDDLLTEQVGNTMRYSAKIVTVYGEALLNG